MPDPLDIPALLAGRAGEAHDLFREHVNPTLAKVLRTIGFDRVWVRGEGPYLFDVEGRKYLDFLAGFGVFNVGRNHPAIREALSSFLGASYPAFVQMDAPLLQGLLAEELKRRVPAALSKVYFTNSGSEGIETALKFARCRTGRSRILYVDHGFHGTTIGALSVNGDEHFREGFAPFVEGSEPVPMDDVEALRAAFARGDVAGIVIEPVQGKGVYVAGNAFLREAESLCRGNGAVLIIDEVQCGLGRTGDLFAFQPSGIVPDILVLSKALSGGYVPVAAVLMREDIYEAVFSRLDRCIVHGTTFGQGGLSMVAGLATLRVLETEGLVENARAMGARLMEGLRGMQERFQFLRDIRGRGLMIGIEFGPPRSVLLKVNWAALQKMTVGLFAQAVVMRLADNHGILTQVAGHNMEVVKLLPSCVISEADVRWFLEAFEETMEACHRFPGPVWQVLGKLAKLSMTRRARATAPTR